MTTITRKIQIYVNESDPDKKKEYWDMLYKWQRIAFQSANYVASHQFIADNVNDMEYYETGIKRKLDNISKDGTGIFTRSKMGTTYQVLSKKYKGELPAKIFDAVNSQTVNTYNKERNDVKKGKKSLRSYRETMPFPVPSVLFNHWNKNGKNYTFTCGNIPLKTRFGRDRSNNQVIMDRCFKGEYKLCDSKIQLKENKTYFLLTVKIPDSTASFSDKKLYAFLSIDVPITFSIDDMVYNIGTKEEYLYRRLQIQESLKRLQMNLKFAKGGHGRKTKLQAIERFHEKEKNYISTRLHTYSRMLINMAAKHNCSTIVLMNQKRREKEAKKDEFVLRNWGYYSLKTKIEYKAKILNINIIEEDYEKL